MTNEEELAAMLSEGLDLCVRARNMDAMDRRQATLAVPKDPGAWVDSGRFDDYVAHHNWANPQAPISVRSSTLPLWVQDQYDRDLYDWENRARTLLQSIQRL